MARRMVRDQAALTALALVALAACSKRGCACLTGYAPEIGVAELDPLSFDLYAPPSSNEGRLTFHLGNPGEEDMCPRLPDGTTVTLNGVEGTVAGLGGTTSTKRGAETTCKRADVSWRDVPLGEEATSTIVIDDGKAKLECSLAVGLPLRLVTPTVKPSGERVPLVVETSAPGATFSSHTGQIGVEGELAQQLVMPDDTRVDGQRLTFSVPSEWLKKPGRHRLVADVGIQTIARCVPARKTPVPSYVHVRATLPFVVTP